MTPNSVVRQLFNNTDIKNGYKDPVSQLSEKFGNVVWNRTVVAGVHNKCSFKVYTIINGKSFSGTGRTLEMAKKSCASMALSQSSKDTEFSNSDYQKQVGVSTTSSVENNYLSGIKSLTCNNNIEKTKKKNRTTLQNITNFQPDINHSLKLAKKNPGPKVLQVTSARENSLPSKDFVFGRKIKGDEIRFPVRLVPKEKNAHSITEEIENEFLITDCVDNTTSKRVPLTEQCSEKQISNNKTLIPGKPSPRMKDSSLLTEEIEDDCVVFEKNKIKNLQTGYEQSHLTKGCKKQISKNELLIPDEPSISNRITEEIEDEFVVANQKKTTILPTCNKEQSSSIKLLSYQKIQDNNIRINGQLLPSQPNHNLPLILDCIVIKPNNSLPTFNKQSSLTDLVCNEITRPKSITPDDQLLLEKHNFSVKEQIADGSLLANTKSLTTQKYSTMDLIKSIEMKVCIKSFAKNPLDFLNLGSNQVENLKKSSKRHREECTELIELPQAKRHANKNKTLYEFPINQLREQGDNAVNCLKSLQPDLDFTLEAEMGSSQEPFFMVSTMIMNRKFFGHGKTIPIAENDAAKQILGYLENNTDQAMCNIGQPKTPSNNQHCHEIVLCNEPSYETCSSLLLSSNYADIIEEKVMQEFYRLTYGKQDFGNYKVLASVVMTFDMNFENCKVVSIATGTKCVNGGNICCNGSVLNDSHAEIVAKRGLMKYLYTQLKHHCSFDSMGDSIFERSTRLQTQYRLKSYVNFHLYISTSPCGDARVFNFNHVYRRNNMVNTSFRNLQLGQLRTKIEGEMGTTPIGTRFYSQTWDGVLLGQPLHTMSCSDKIALWNVVGIQGALLSQFVEPIYLHSIVLGSLFDVQHLYRAVCGRIQHTLGHLPQPYRLNRPLLGQTSKPLRRRTFKSPSIGINWTWGDTDIEIIELPTGRRIYNEISFLSKQAFFFKFVYLCRNLPNEGCILMSNNYADAKQNAKDFQHAKTKVFDAFYRANLGIWVKKPIEQNDFVMNFN